MLRRVLLVTAGILCGLALLVGCQQIRNSDGPPLTSPPQDGLRVASYNVHYILQHETSGRWSAARWQARKAPLDATFKALDADIVAFQEMETFGGGNDDSVNLARDWLLQSNPDFSAAAIGDWRQFPSTQPIFYRADKLVLEGQGWFFFSDTPEVIYSRTFDGSYPAFASWADLRLRDTDRLIRVMNLHLDYASGENRRKSIELVTRRVTAWREQGRAVILAGDLNARAGSELHRALEAAGLHFLTVDGSSFHFDIGLNLFGAIDHIAYSSELVPIGDAVVYRDKLGATWPSDHYPVVADFE